MESGTYRLRSAETSLQKLTAARIDLRIAREMLEHCVETDGGLHDECEQFEEACWTTATLRYKRCFEDSAVRQEVLAQLSDDELESHYYFCYLRDKMFSHSVGVGQDFEVTAYVARTTQTPAQLVAIGPMPRRICSPGADLAKEFLALVEVLLPRVEAAYEREASDAIRRLRALPLGEVVKGEPVEQAPLPWGRDQPDFQRYMRKGKVHPNQRLRRS